MEVPGEGRCFRIGLIGIQQHLSSELTRPDRSHSHPGNDAGDGTLGRLKGVQAVLRRLLASRSEAMVAVVKSLTTRTPRPTKLYWMYRESFPYPKRKTTRFASARSSRRRNEPAAAKP